MSDQNNVTPDQTSQPATNAGFSNLDRLPPPAQFASPPRDPSLPNIYYAKNYMNDDVPKFRHTSEANLTAYGSLFGISAIEINVDGFDIRGSGSIAISSSGLFQGRLHFNNYNDVGQPEQKYQLVCQHNTKDSLLYIFFLQPPDMTAKAMFVGQIPGSTNREFSGVFQFN